MTDERQTGSQAAIEDVDLETVTRIHISTELGAYEFWADTWRPEVQDDGRTLKLFGRGTGGSAKTQRAKALAQHLTDAIHNPLTSREDNE